MRILFMGTPDFAVASLRRLVEDGHEICGVLTQPDKPKNRRHGPLSRGEPIPGRPALTKKLAVYQPAALRNSESLELVRSLKPELIVVAAYGKLLPEDILNVPPLGSINVHSSLLAKELDAGDVILQKSTSIGETEDAQALTRRLAELGAEALSETVKALGDGTAARIPQDHEKHTYAPMLGKELSPVDWTRSAHEISCQVRGLIPWPCAATDVISGEEMKLYAVQETGEETSARPGTVTAAGKQGIDLACGDGKILRVTELQAKGGKRMSAGAYLLGHPIQR